MFAIELPDVTGWPRPEMVRIPPGQVRMGMYEYSHLYRTEVRIEHSFALGKCLVTFADWDATVAARGEPSLARCIRHQRLGTGAAAGDLREVGRGTGLSSLAQRQARADGAAGVLPAALGSGVGIRVRSGLRGQMVFRTANMRRLSQRDLRRHPQSSPAVMAPGRRLRGTT
jgi:hypothetical protein